MHTTTVIVGAGHAGLAMLGRLTERSIDHVVLERGEVANSWRTERWDSLRLLTPNWLTRLPGQAYGGDDPDSYMTVPEVVDLVAGYASACICAGPHSNQGDLVFAPLGQGPATRSSRIRGHGPAAAWCWRAARAQHPRRPELERSRPRVARNLHIDELPRAWAARRPRCARRAGVGHRGAARRRDPSVGTSGHALGGSTRGPSPDVPRPRTSSGGCTPPACWTSATTKSTTSSAPVTCRRPS